LNLYEKSLNMRYLNIETKLPMTLKIKIDRKLEKGYVITILPSKAKQIIPEGLLDNRIKWGLYDLMNPEMLLEKVS